MPDEKLSVNSSMGRSVNYQSTSSSREPIWTRVANDPLSGSCSGYESNESYDRSLTSCTSSEPCKGKGLNVFNAAVFVAGEMAGSGILALPKAVVDCGWIGLVLVVVFCLNACYGGCRLGKCWTILEERYPEHRASSRNPYSTIAYRAYGRWCSLLVSGCIQVTLFGAGVVYLLLAAQIFQELLRTIVPEIGYCMWFLIFAVLTIPVMWLGSPKDFSFAGIGALLTTILSCFLIIAQIATEGLELKHPPQHAPHTFKEFFLAFGVILFAYGGASTFPTIQNDMTHREKFPKSVAIGFAVIFLLYLPVSFGGYFVYGDAVNSNILLSLQRGPFELVANILMAMHLLLAFFIVVNPVSQEIEEIFDIPHSFCWKRCIIRTLMVVAMIVVGETIPKFGMILALVGGSTITLTTFVLPSLLYMKLCDQKSVDWPDRYIPLYERVYMWELIVIGLLGGAASTYSAMTAIFSADALTKPCYWPDVK
ncbi:amino acid transporter AVT1A-like isoform X1 [Nilaparvata lugens]|uniref:amino acid transporter AVT1A-like isoform X1 n=1 Tax=Nilaparvata lugens TaxID=108931 RepID=UPI00193E4105|nr:amino acid transporter AVT1A-like isoform X1 [Nilaparvata lugens]